MAAIGAGKARYEGLTLWAVVLLGGLMAAILNAASNVLNQVHDLELDRVNKPHRPLVTGAVTLRGARRYALWLYAIATAAAFAVQPDGVPELGLIVLPTVVLTWAYSAPPIRARNSWWFGPLVIAIPRGGLLKVAGWASVAPVRADAEPWWLALVFFLFVLGAAPTKDFSDMEGDRLGGASSLPLRFGPRRAAWIMAPFYVLPWVLLAVMTTLPPPHGLRADPSVAFPLCLLLAGHAAFTVAYLARHAERGLGLGVWRNLYLLMMEAQVGLAVLYLWPSG